MGCSICLDGYGADDDAAHRPVGLVPCGHVFHQGCLLDLLRSGSSRLATQADVRAHRRALHERKRHPLHLQRMRADPVDRRAQQAHAAAAAAAADDGAAPGPSSRARLTFIAPDEQQRQLRSAAAAALDADSDDGSDGPANAYEFYEADGTPGLVVPSTPIVVCPLCKSVCPIDAILDLWPSEHDDLDIFKQLMLRPGSGATIGASRLSRAISVQDLFRDLVLFHRSLSAYVMHSHSVDLRSIQRSGSRVLQLVERLTSYNSLMQEFKDAIDALLAAAGRFECSFLSFQEKSTQMQKREADLQNLQRILDEKDANLAVLAANLADQKKQLDADRNRIKGEKIRIIDEMEVLKSRTTAMEDRERAARRSEREATLKLRQGLAQRDIECQARVDAAEERAQKAEQAQSIADRAYEQAHDRQGELAQLLAKSKRRSAKALEELAELRKKYEKLKREKKALPQDYPGSSGELRLIPARSSTPLGSLPDHAAAIGPPAVLRPVLHDTPNVLPPSSLSTMRPPAKPRPFANVVEKYAPLPPAGGGSSQPGPDSSQSLSLSVQKEDLSAEADDCYVMPGMTYFAGKGKGQGARALAGGGGGKRIRIA